MHKLQRARQITVVWRGVGLSHINFNGHVWDRFLRSAQTFSAIEKNTIYVMPIVMRNIPKCIYCNSLSPSDHGPLAIAMLVVGLLPTLAQLLDIHPGTWQMLQLLAPQRRTQAESHTHNPCPTSPLNPYGKQRDLQ